MWYATKKEQLSISQTIDLILCKLSKTYLHRERIQKRILSTIPNYKSSIREINNHLKNSPKLERDVISFSKLTKVIKMADSLNFKISFCALPLPKSYQIYPDIISKINQSPNCRLIDFQNEVVYTGKDFLDGYHLNKVGAEKYTKRFSNYLLTDQLYFEK